MEKESKKNNEVTFIIIKPDAVEAHLERAILKRIENIGLITQILDRRILNTNELRGHYKDVVDEPFYPAMEEYMTSGKSVLLVAKGVNAITRTRGILGATRIEKRTTGTIKSDYGHPTITYINGAHASDSEMNCKRELGIFFSDKILTSLKLPYTKK